MNLTALTQAYAESILTPTKMVEELIRHLEAFDKTGNPVWISRLNADQLREAARTLEVRKAQGEEMPLYGVPYAVKDNIDALGFPTTAACPEYGYHPAEDATAVALLRKAGALLVGKTNLDQFATGLVGTRSPYGAVQCVFDSSYISGGSSSGSAVAVAAGLVTFALGTDTAGSGRVPAAFNHLVGYKATRGRVSTKGVVPACRSLDCVTVFAREIGEASQVMEIIARFDTEDSFSRAEPPLRQRRPIGAQAGHFTFAVPEEAQWQFFGDLEAEKLYRKAIKTFEARGGRLHFIDDEKFREAAKLLYAGPWVAERTVAIADFLECQAQAIHPVVREIVAGGKAYSACDAFQASYRLAELRRATESLWETVDFLLLPTAPTQYRICEVEADPVVLNSRLGTYTNFVNLLDLAALAVPVGFRPNGLAFGVSLIGPAWSDALLTGWGEHLHPSVHAPVVSESDVVLAVCGAHLRGQALHHQILACGGEFLEESETAPVYAMYALDTQPPKPALIRSVEPQPNGIEVELYRFTATGFGQFMKLVPSPLAIGTLLLHDGSTTKGFIGEAYASEQALDITSLKGWRAFR